MFADDLNTAHSAMRRTVETLRANSSTATGDELRDALRTSHTLIQLAAQVQVEAVGALERNGVFAACGYRRRPDSAVANLLGVDRSRAKDITTAAARVCTRIYLQGQVLPPVLAGTAAAFAAGSASLAHVTVIGQLMDSHPARRLTPDAWAAVEEQIAAVAGEYTPHQLDTWGAQLIAAYDQDGAEPDDTPPAQVNELRLSPLSGGGGVLKGRFEDPVRYATIAAVIDA